MSKKIYWRAKEVAALLGEPKSTLFFWEEEFDHLKILRSPGGERLYTESNINDLRIIVRLLREEKFTIPGAKEYLRQNKKQLDQEISILSRLEKIHQKLEDLRASLKNTD